MRGDDTEVAIDLELSINQLKVIEINSQGGR